MFYFDCFWLGLFCFCGRARSAVLVFTPSRGCHSYALLSSFRPSHIRALLYVKTASFHSTRPQFRCPEIASRSSLSLASLRCHQLRCPDYSPCSPLHSASEFHSCRSIGTSLCYGFRFASP